MSPEPTGGFKENAENLNVPADVQGELNDPEPMSEAERGAAEVLRSAWCDAHFVNPDLVRLDSWDGLARAVVAAVGPIRAAEALEAATERLLDHADRVRTKFPHQPSGHNRSYGLSEAASMLRADIAALRTTTSEEPTDV
ncbi:MAG TPA: hypothetical protein VHG10_00690 [Glycomyces sp.]|nr:hypothetical protein [Glycomyces sp.]